MEPEEIKRINEFEEEIDRAYDQDSRRLYDFIRAKGIEAFREEGKLRNFVKSDLFEKLIEHFESKEEYERCAYLLKISNEVKQLYSPDPLLNIIG
jgi:hypothetical protein